MVLIRLYFCINQTCQTSISKSFSLIRRIELHLCTGRQWHVHWLNRKYTCSNQWKKEWSWDVGQIPVSVINKNDLARMNSKVEQLYICSAQETRLCSEYNFDFNWDTYGPWLQELVNRHICTLYVTAYWPLKYAKFTCFLQ